MNQTKTGLEQIQAKLVSKRQAWRDERKGGAHRLRPRAATIPQLPPGACSDAELDFISVPLSARTFCKWLNSKLETKGIPPMTSLATDLSDGVKLIQVSQAAQIAA